MVSFNCTYMFSVLSSSESASVLFYKIYLYCGGDREEQTVNSWKFGWLNEVQTNLQEELFLEKLQYIEIWKHPGYFIPVSIVSCQNQ